MWDSSGQKYCQFMFGISENSGSYAAIFSVLEILASNSNTSSCPILSNSEEDAKKAKKTKETRVAKGKGNVKKYPFNSSLRCRTKRRVKHYEKNPAENGTSCIGVNGWSPLANLRSLDFFECSIACLMWCMLLTWELVGNWLLFGLITIIPSPHAIFENLPHEWKLTNVYQWSFF